MLGGARRNTATPPKENEWFANTMRCTKPTFGKSVTHIGGTLGPFCGSIKPHIPAWCVVNLIHAASNFTIAAKRPGRLAAMR